MKIISKLSGVLFSICLLLMLIPNTAEAASGRIYFSDLTTEAGVEFDVTITVVSYDDNMDGIQFVLDYDNTAIQFLSGSGVTDTGSQLTYTVDEVGSIEEEIVLTFMALTQGDTSITIDSQSITNSSDDVFEVQEGNSAISIEGGTEVEPTTTTTTDVSGGDDVVTVDDVSYSIASTSFASIIPEGYTEMSFEYGDNSYYGAQGDSSGIVLAYLINDSGEGTLFCYDVDGDYFYPYVQVSISDDIYIVFSRTEIGATLPDQYVETVLSVSGYEFPTWEDTSNTGIYLIYATNSNGEAQIYQYDSVEKTYQKYIGTSISSDGTSAVGESTFISKLLGENSTLVLMVCISFMLILIVAVVILGFMIYNRNGELDDLYDEIEELESKQKALIKVGANMTKKASGKPGAKQSTAKAGVRPTAKAGERSTAKDGERIAAKPGARPTAKPGARPGARPAAKPGARPITKKSEEFDSIAEAIASELNKSKAGQFEEFDREVNNRFEEKFDDKFDDGFDEEFDINLDDDFEKGFTKSSSKNFSDDFEVTLPPKMLKDEELPRRSIKSAASRRKENTTRYDDIDFIDL